MRGKGEHASAPRRCRDRVQEPADQCQRVPAKPGGVPRERGDPHRDEPDGEPARRRTEGAHDLEPDPHHGSERRGDQERAADLHVPHVRRDDARAGQAGQADPQHVREGEQGEQQARAGQHERRDRCHHEVRPSGAGQAGPGARIEGDRGDPEADHGTTRQQRDQSQDRQSVDDEPASIRKSVADGLPPDPGREGRGHQRPEGGDGPQDPGQQGGPPSRGRTRLAGLRDSPGGHGVRRMTQVPATAPISTARPMPRTQASRPASASSLAGAGLAATAEGAGRHGVWGGGNRRTGWPTPLPGRHPPHPRPAPP